MPTVTYRGRWPTKRTPFGEYLRGIPQEVTQDWLNDNRQRVVKDSNFVIADDTESPVPPVEGEVPDDGWTRQQIYEWLTLHDIRARAGLTKKQLFGLVRETLGLEDEEPTEEPMNETVVPEVELDSGEQPIELEVNE